MSHEIETRRNEWVAKQLGVKSVYRDDNCFVDYDDPSGVAIAFVQINGDEREVLTRNSAPYDDIAVLPFDYWLGLR